MSAETWICATCGLLSRQAATDAKWQQRIDRHIRRCATPSTEEEAARA